MQLLHEQVLLFILGFILVVCIWGSDILRATAKEHMALSINERWLLRS